jgi:Tlde1 domain
VRGGEIRAANTLGLDGGLFVGAGLRSIAAAVVGFAAALALGLPGAFSNPPGSATIAAKGSDGSASPESWHPEIRGWRVASLETELVSAPAGEALDARPLGSKADRSNGSSPAFGYVTSLEERRPPTRSPPGFEREPSFEELWKAATRPDELDSSATPAEAALESNSPPDEDDLDHAAVYDIAAHTVYLPDGKRLEAHSGLGRLLDDPRYAHIKDRGPTPPNVYDLSLRERNFHGVRALRLNPAGGDKMFGRDGLLAHSYLHGSNGQSNGCVAFRDYSAFLSAYLSGEIDRLVVVDHLAATPSAGTAAGWVPETVKAPPGRS